MGLFGVIIYICGYVVFVDSFFCCCSGYVVCCVFVNKVWLFVFGL